MVHPFSARLIAALAIAVVLASGCEPPEVDDDPVSVRAESQQIELVSDVGPAPAPDHCADYGNMEAGTGHPENQHWFDHLRPDGYARVRLACIYGGGTNQWECLWNLWDRESRWGAWDAESIPQAKPASKQAQWPGGPDWRTNQRTQVRWGLHYIYVLRSDYNNACDAWRLWQARRPHWY